MQQQEDEQGFVEWASGEPGSIVRGRVCGYTGYREASSTPVQRVETPAGNLSLIVSFGDEFFASATAGAEELSSYTSFAVGLHDRPSRTAHDGRQLGVQIGLDPCAAFSLLAVPLHELGNRVVVLDELLGADAERWAGQMAEMRGWQQRFWLLDRLLGERLAAGPQPSPALVWAWRTMQDAGGSVPIADLVHGAGCSHRHLVAQFREQVGATPKTAARLLRYTRAARLLTGGDLRPAQVAALCGYADQSHLTRDYARFAGTTPGAAQLSWTDPLMLSSPPRAVSSSTMSRASGSDWARRSSLVTTRVSPAWHGSQGFA